MISFTLILILIILFLLSLTSLFYLKNIINFAKNHKKITAAIIATMTVSAGITLLPLGNQPRIEDARAYDFWYPPANTFGMGIQKTLNWTYWKGWLKDTFNWGLRASTTGADGSWQNANSLLNVGLKFDKNNGTAKVTLTLNTTNAPKALYYQFYIGCNKSILQYVNMSDKWDWQLTLPANNTENYTIDFNWSDIKPLVQNGKVTINNGMKNGMIYFLVTSVNKVPVGTIFVIDPTFGYTTATTSFSAGIDDTIVGVNNCTARSGNGIANSITCYIKSLSSSKSTKITCALYYGNNGNLVAQTEQRIFILTTTWSWKTFNFTSTVNIVNNTNYNLTIWANVSGGTPALGGKSSGGTQIFFSKRVTYTGTYPNPLTSTTKYSYYNMDIYCSYDRVPTFSNPSPTNGSTGIALTPQQSITIADKDANTMNLYWYSSTDGTSYTYRAHNLSCANGTYRQTASWATLNSQLYYWTVYANDTHGANVSSWYTFTTVAGGGKTYSATIRNYGLDYFIWLGSNCTAYNVSLKITGFNSASEYIAIWHNGTWSDSFGAWQRFYGDKSGTNFTIHTFDVVQVNLADAVGNQTITMYQNNYVNYTNSKNITLRNLTQNKGFNYTGYNKIAATTLSTINTNIGLPTGYYVGAWNRTSFQWNIWISGFSDTNYAVNQWGVVTTKTDTTRWWNT